MEELAYILAEAGSQVEDDRVGRGGLGGGFEERQDVGLVDGLFGQGKDREAVEAEAWVVVCGIRGFAEGLDVGDLGFAGGDVGVGLEEFSEVGGDGGC